jgi:hypothetical protein
MNAPTPSPEYLARRKLAEALAKSARQLDAPPKYQWHDRVHVRGERLSQPIAWRGRQSSVTRYGIECRDGTYAIAADRYEEGGEFGWVMHMAGKEWVDLPDFAEALRVARRIKQQKDKR